MRKETRTNAVMKIDWLFAGPMASAVPWQTWGPILVSLTLFLALFGCRRRRERVSAELRCFQIRIAVGPPDNIGPTLSKIETHSRPGGGTTIDPRTPIPV